METQRQLVRWDVKLIGQNLRDKSLQGRTKESSRFFPVNFVQLTAPWVSEDGKVEEYSADFAKTLSSDDKFELIFFQV